MTATETESWLPTKEAAAMLGVSPRELQRKVVAYPLQLRRRQQRDGRKTVALYHAGDLEVFHRNTLDGIDPAYTEKVMAVAATPRRRELAAMPGDRRPALMLRAPSDGLAERQEPPAIMTIAEAANAYGIPYAWLRAECRAGKLGRNVGTSKRQIWRISRRQLEAYF